MTLGNPQQFDHEYLKKWWEVTRRYLIPDSASEPSAAERSGGSPRRMIRGRGNQADTRPPVHGATTGDEAWPHPRVDGQSDHCNCHLPGRIGPPIAANADRAVLTRKGS